MGTASTKSRARKRKRAHKETRSEESAAFPVDARRQREPETPPQDASHSTEFPAWLWLAASALILITAAALRLYAYDIKPFHHDEGVNGFFLIDLFRNYHYQYNPENYHGPSLYYFALGSSRLFGLNDFAVRFVPAIFGVATVALVLLLRRYIGSVGSLAAAALLALSPCAVFYSRYFIHESLFVFFSVAIVVAALRYYETVKLVYPLLIAVAAALLFATKETALITAGVLLIALVTTEIYQRMEGRRGAPRLSKKMRRQQSRYARPAPRMGLGGTLARFGQSHDLIMVAAIAVGLFILVHVLFYSSFFTYAKGLNDSLATFKIWMKTGTSEFHAKPFGTYLKWLLQEEALLFLLGMAGVFVAALRATNRFAIFAALWAIGMIAAYSLVPYKTPWLTLNFIPPLAICAGYTINTIYQQGRDTLSRIIALALLLAALSLAAYQTVVLNFYQYDNEEYPYVYAHTQRGYLTLIREIQGAAERAGTGAQTTIAIASPDYWPMPWYLRNFQRVAYPGSVGANTEQIVVCNSTQEAQFQSALGSRYHKIGSYPLRNGIMLTLFVRNDIP